MAIKWAGKWESLGRPQETEIGSPFAQSNEDGKLEVFTIGRGGAFNISQIAPNAGWADGWRSKDRPSLVASLQTHVVGKNADGRLEIFALGMTMPFGKNGRWRQITVGANGKRWAHPRMTRSLPGNSLSGEIRMADRKYSRPFWSKWESLGNPPAKIRLEERLTVGTNQDGRLEVFVVGLDGGVWHTWQIR